MERRYPQARPIAIDFFCGAGGMSLGFEQAGFDVVLGVDIDGHHVATHDRNFPYGKSICASIADLSAEEIREAIDSDRDIDLVFGGPPCQGFSNMGLRDLRDPRNSLIDHFVRMILELRPKAFVMENVPGMLAGETRKILDSVLKLTGENGYNVAQPVRVLNAADFGVPQSRRRLFVLGIRDDVGDTIAYPEGKCNGQPDRPTVIEAIGDLPEIERDDHLFVSDYARYVKQPKGEYARVARGIVVDPSDLSRPRGWDDKVSSGCMRIRHSDASVDMYGATPPGQTVPGHKLPRLDPNGLCTTLRAGSDSSHGSYTAPRPIHPKLPRCITAREAARLHGYPDWFSFYPMKWHAYRQIGNSVCPPVARAIGYQIREALGGKTTKRAPAVVELYDSFVLPQNRLKTLKRIPIIEQFPPVVGNLFERAYDRATGKIKKAKFSFSDVERAIKSLGVNLHWVRADTFLAEIARSRRVNDILAPVLESGYSIRPCQVGSAIGEFVPLGTPGTIESREELNVRTDEILTADKIDLASLDLNGSGWGVVGVLTQRQVQQKLWNRTDCVVGLVDGPRETSQNGSSLYTVSLRRSPKFDCETLPVIACTTAALPNKARIARVAKKEQSNDVVILAAATKKHVVALHFVDSMSSPKEAVRAAFEIA